MDAQPDVASSTATIPVVINLSVNAESEPEAFTKVYQALAGVPGLSDVRFGTMQMPDAKQSRREFWRGQDWNNKTMHEIAEETGKTYECVAAWRLKLFGAFHPGLKRKEMKNAVVPPGKWKELDWLLQDVVLARQLGINRERVRQVRRRLQMPDPVTKHFRVNVRPRYELIADEIRPRLAEIQGMSIRQISLLFRHNAQQINQALDSLGFTPRDGRFTHNWSLVNWDLPNKMLNEIWGFKRNVCASYRHKHKLPHPRWFANVNWQPKPEMLEAIRLEREKASQQIQQVNTFSTHSSP